MTLVSAQTFGGLSPAAMTAVGLMGFSLTLGIVLYDLRNSDLYNAVVHRAKMLEGIMGFARYGGETAKATPSEAALLARIAAAAGGRGAPDAKAGDGGDRASPVPLPGGAHRQRAVSYLRFLSLDVTHGSALALVYGVLLGAWAFPVAKGALVLLGESLVNHGGYARWSERSGLLTSTIAFVLAALAACLLWRSLAAADVPGASVALYLDEEGQDAVREDILTEEQRDDRARQSAAKEFAGFLLRKRVEERGLPKWLLFVGVQGTPRSGVPGEWWARLRRGRGNAPARARPGNRDATPAAGSSSVAGGAPDQP